MVQRVLLAAVIALLALLVAATSTPALQPKRGGVHRIAEREAPSLDPHLSISFLPRSHVSLAYSQLVRYLIPDADRHHVKGLAEAIEEAGRELNVVGS